METLAVALPEIVSILGNELGYGRGTPYGDPEHNDRQAQMIKDCWVSGLRKFYRCGYEWSFLQPVYPATIAEGESSVLLPAELNGPTGRAWVSSPDGRTRFGRLDFVSDDRVLAALAAEPDRTGRPTMLAVTPASAGAGAGRTQRKKLICFPAVNADFVIEAKYTVIGDVLTEVMPYALGADAHAETIIAACLSAAELRRYGRAGVHQQEFARLLAVSQREDRRLKPQVMGQNDNGGHWSDPTRGTPGNPRLADLPPVTYAGTQY